MNTPSQTPSVHALSGAYTLDALDGEELRSFEAHLPQCADCRAEVASLREAAAIMTHDATSAPPSRLRANILAEIKTVRPLPPSTAPMSSTAGTHADPERNSGVSDLGAHRERRRPSKARIALLGAAAAAVLGLGVGSVWQPWHQDDSSTQASSTLEKVLAAPDAQRVETPVIGGGKVTVVRTVVGGRAAVVTTGMPPAPQDKVYELWLLSPSGRMVPAGLMNRSGEHAMLLAGDATRATAVGITVEPSGGSKSPTSTPIALADLTKSST